MAVRRLLRRMLGGREARALGEVHHAGGHQREAGTGTPRGFEVLQTQFRVLLQRRQRMALHEGEVQRPPHQPDHRHPDQLLLEEELEEGNAAIEDPLQHEDVDPGAVVAVHQVPAARSQTLEALHVPGRGRARRDPDAVARDPVRRHGIGHVIERPAHRRQRQQQLDDGGHQDGQGPEHRVEDQQQQIQDGQDGGGQQAHEGRKGITGLSV